MLQLSVVNFKKGAYIVIEGNSENDKFFIIQRGQLSCFVNNKRTGTKPIVLGPGDFVGVVPCMAERSQIESAVALTDVSCISVQRDQYSDLIKLNTPVAIKIIRTFASRVRTLNETLAQLTTNSGSVASEEQIFNTAAFYEKKSQIDVAVYAYYQYLKTAPNGMYASIAQKRFVALKPISHAVYFESVPDLTRKYPRGTMVFSDSQSGNDLFIIKEGQVKITKVVNGKEVMLAMLKKGDMFGEMALLENKPRSASAIATEDTILMTVNRKNFDQMVATQPQLVATLTTTLAERIWSMHRKLANSGLSNLPERMVDMLALQIEKNKVAASSHDAFQTDYTPQNIAELCGIDSNSQREVIEKFMQLAHVKYNRGKILVPDCLELVKQAEFFRKPKRGLTSIIM